MLNLGDRIRPVGDTDRLGTVTHLDGDSLDGEVLEAGDDESVWVEWDDRKEKEPDYLGEWEYVEDLEKVEVQT